MSFLMDCLRALMSLMVLGEFSGDVVVMFGVGGVVLCSELVVVVLVFLLMLVLLVAVGVLVVMVGNLVGS